MTFEFYSNKKFKSDHVNINMIKSLFFHLFTIFSTFPTQGFCSMHTGYSKISLVFKNTNNIFLTHCSQFCKEISPIMLNYYTILAGNI